MKTLKNSVRPLGLLFAILGLATSSRAFQIIVDLNTLHAAEASILQNASDYRTSQLAADGVWMAPPLNSTALRNNPDPFDNPTWWKNIIANLNGNNWTITEDVYDWLGTQWAPDGAQWSNTAIYSLRSYPRAICQAMVYQEGNPASDTVLTASGPDQITGAFYASFPAPVVVLARRYNFDGTRWINTLVDNALNHGYCGGVTFEIGINQNGPGTPGNEYPTLNLPAGITACLNRGKPCYILLSPAFVNGAPSCTDYTAAVSGFMGWLNSQFSDGPSSVLHNPQLYIVVARYGTDSVGFIDGGANYTNNLRSAVVWLKAFRLWGYY